MKWTLEVIIDKSIKTFKRIFRPVFKPLKTLIKNILKTQFWENKTQKNNDQKKKKLTIKAIKQKLKQEISKLKIILIEAKIKYLPIIFGTTKNYISKNKSKINNKVIYTIIANDYDELSQPYFTKDTWDYICFTDNQELIKKGQIGVWQILPLLYTELDVTRNTRYHKINPHLVLPEKYEESIYIDANVNILSNFLFKTISKKEKNILMPTHFNKDCAYEEADWALQAKMDYEHLIKSQFELYQKEGFPRNYGFFEANIIYRKHKDSEVIQLMEDWWYFVKNYARRDQLSIAFVFYKHNKNIAEHSFKNARFDFKDFYVTKHTKPRIHV